MTTRPGYVWDATASEWVEIGQAAVVAPIAYQTSAPSSPATGDIWIDSDDEVPSVDSTLYYRWTKTMSGGETSLSGTDDNSLALEYTPGYESVFINGVLQVRGSDYVATTGTTVTGLTALTASDVVMVESIVAYSVGDTYTQSQIGSLLDAKSPVSTTGLVLLSTTTISSGVSSVAVTNAFSATYEQYQISVTNAQTSAADAWLHLQLGSTTSGYYGVISVANYSNGAFTGGGNFSNSSNFSYLFAISNPATNLSGGSVIISNPFATKRTTINGFVTRLLTTGYAGTVGGFQNSDTSFTGFTLISSAGTITSGTIKVYGYK